MIRIALTLLVSFLLLRPSLVGAVVVDLRSAQRAALEHNLELRAQMFEAHASEATVKKSKGTYDPWFELFLSGGSDRRRINSRAEETSTLKEENRRVDLTVEQKLPTGADLSLTFDNSRSDDEPGAAINPSYSSNFEVELNQPLLKGAGRTVTEKEILFAIKDREVAVQDLREEAFRILNEVRDSYFDVLRFRDEVRYRKTSISLASRILADNRAKVKAGILPPVEELEAEVGLARRERDLVDAERSYEDALDQLALLMNLSDEIRLVDQVLGRPQVNTDEEEGLDSAFSKRPDLLRQQSRIQRVGIEEKVAKNLLLPQLDLSGSYGRSGLGQDYGANIDDIESNDFENWEVGLTLSYPIGNREARNEHLRTRFELKSAHARLAYLKQQVLNDIRSSIRFVRSSGKKIEVTQRERELAEEKLRLLLSRKDVGLATTRDALEGEDDLAAARTDEIIALAEYNKAFTQYLRVTGNLLEHEGIRFVGPLGEGNNISPWSMAP